MKLTILLFATLKDKIGQGQIALELSDLPTQAVTLVEVRAALRDQYPSAAEALRSAVAAINEEFAFDGDSVKDGDQVAFFPPVSGGAPSDNAGYPEIFRLDAGELDFNALIRAITLPATGAVCTFSGTVRGETASDKISGRSDPTAIQHTSALYYEAYEAMAITKMRQVAAEIRTQWALVQGIAIVQRVGRLEVGEPTIAIAVAAAHRDQGCFEAARYGIDRLKEIVPVWKKEIGSDGAEWVEGSYNPTPTDRTVR